MILGRIFIEYKCAYIYIYEFWRWGTATLTGFVRESIGGPRPDTSASTPSPRSRGRALTGRGSRLTLTARPHAVKPYL